MARSWTFQVNAMTFPGEVVCVVGSCPELGTWIDVKPMEIKNSDSIGESHGGEEAGEANTWATEIKIPDGINVNYRYVICRFLDEKMLIQRYETSLVPRKIACYESCDFDYVTDFSTEIQRGWLTSQSIVQLKLFGDNSLNFWKSKFKGKKFCVKVSSSEDGQNWSMVTVAALLSRLLSLSLLQWRPLAR